MRARWSKRRFWLVLILVVVLLASPPTGFVAWRLGTSNLVTLQPGRIQRSAQMGASRLTETIKSAGVKTVLNLRGVNAKESWYVAELDATASAGATQVDFKMASDQWLSRAQLRTLIRILDSSEYPLLIHCESGSERTGLVSAIAELLRPGGTLQDARNQFSIRYLFRLKDKNKVLPAHLDQYEAWLQARNQAHEPALFRQWARESFRPGQPSREYWPYNPDPLVVITRSASATRLGSLPEKSRR